jgi:hypothetical protein
MSLTQRAVTMYLNGLLISSTEAERPPHESQPAGVPARLGHHCGLGSERGEGRPSHVPSSREGIE